LHVIEEELNAEISKAVDFLYQLLCLLRVIFGLLDEIVEITIYSFKSAQDVQE
jgi:hypothetical protein